MGNALSSSPAGGPPPAPNPNPIDTSGSAPPTPYGSGNALGGPPQGQQQQQAPAPTHQQTVAALRHFGAIEEELSEILSDPDLGKSDMKSKIIDGATRLVSTGILTPAEAVAELGAVPEQPFEQKAWLEKQFMDAIQGQTAVLAHHQAGYAGQNVDTTPPDPANHTSDIAALTGQYKGAQGNA